MGNVRHVVLVALAVILATALGRAGHAAEMRFALVIGNDEYKSAKLATPANDAGLIANALQAAGFTVTGARNLDQATLRESFREFVDQLAAAGPDAVAFVYLAGFGLQFEGENYFVPVDADPQRDVDIPLQAVRMSDFMQPLAALPGRVKIVILDAARQNQFARGGQPLAGGLALVDPGPNVAIAFNAAPGTVGPDEQGPYGAYATSLTEMIAAGGLGLDDVFARVRLRVSELTNGGEIPWYASQIEGPFFFTDRVADAPPPPSAVPLADLRRKPMRGYSSAEDAYEAALAIDSMEAYEQFLAAYPDSPFARRISAMLAVRREEIIWRRCVLTDTPPAYWSYLRRYPRGPHVWDARRRLARLGGAMEPPPSFAFIEFGVPPPPAFELDFVGQPVLVLWGPSFAPPPRPPLVFLPPRPSEFAVLPPPPAARERFSLPAPAAPVVPAFVRPPRNVAPAATSPGAAPPGGRPAAAVALPAAVQSKATPGAPGAKPAAPAAAPSSAAVNPAPAPPPPSSAAPAAVKPGTPPPATGPAPATVKPGTPPPPPATGPAPATVKPGTPPPPPPATGPPPATVKPGTLPPPPATGPAPATVKPGTLPPPPPATGPAPATVKPSTPPPPATVPAPATIKPGMPPPPPPATGPAPATVKPAKPPPPPPTSPAPATVKPAVPPPPPAPPKPAAAKPAPPPPPPPAAAPKPAAAKPAPPPPPPAASPPAAAAGKPACPPGKTLAQVAGHPTCK
jgi:uncharacterized caspase-like protein